MRSNSTKFFAEFLAFSRGVPMAKGAFFGQSQIGGWGAGSYTAEVREGKGRQGKSKKPVTQN
jgi:hypothetical protein